jgi:gliding motility-associated-like protein
LQAIATFLSSFSSIACEKFCFLPNIKANNCVLSAKPRNYKQSMKKFILLLSLISFLFLSFSVSSQNNLCSSADPFCTGTTYNFPAGVNAPDAETGPNYGCLYSEPNPAWYFMQVGTSGVIEIEMHSTPQHDIDFACWGPFPSSTAPCVAQLTAGSGLSSHAASGPSSMYPSLNMVDCSYSTSWQEWCYIPNAVVGQYYILMITNFSNQPCNIIFSQTSGNGTSDCGILAPPVTGDTVCVGETIHLTVNNPTNGATYHWTGPNGFISNSMNPTIPNATPAMAGTYSMTITIGAQTSPAVTCNVLVNPNPTVSIGPANPTTCSGAPVSLTPSSTTGLTWYVWSDGSQGTGDITVSPTTPTSYCVTGTDLNGCSGTACITVNINPDLVLSVTPPSPFVCIGTSIDLTASGADNYTWVPDSSLSTTSGATVTASPIVTTTYTVSGNNAAGCTGVTTVTVLAETGPNIQIFAEPDHICPGDTSTLTVFAIAQSYTWSPGISLTSTSTAITQAYPLTTTAYTVTANNNGCISTRDITITVEPLPKVDFTADIREACQGLKVHFSDLTSPEPISWIWNFGDNLIYGNTSALRNPTHYYEDAGSFDVSLSVVTPAGCKMKMLFPDYIITHPNPMAFFEVKPEVVNELEPLVWFNDQSVGANIWNWYFGEPNVIGNNSNLQNPTHVYSDTGTYHPVLVVFTNYGCTDTISGEVTVRPNMTIYVPNAFTPNKDNKNSIFRAFGEGIDLSTFEMRIYDRWGRQVYLSNDIEKGWDGTYNGKTAIEGVYIWYITYFDAMKHSHTLKGFVTLII